VILPTPLGKKLTVLWRSLWIQASWSFTGMQTVGFVHALEPLVEGTDEERRDKLLNHLEFFNTHPFLAPAAVASAAVAEAQSHEPSAEAAEARRFMMGAMGGMGDSFFWGGLKMFAAVVGVLLAVEGAMWAPVAMVGLFLLANLATRVWTLEKGLKHGKMALLEIQKQKPVYRSSHLKLVVAALLGWIAVRHAAGGASALGFTESEGIAFALVVALATVLATRRGTDPLLIIYAALVAAIYLGVK
jgi:PTS system mannose-specific IID component